MNIDPTWPEDRATEAGIVGPWEQHGDVWVRRWVQLPDVGLEPFEGGYGLTSNLLPTCWNGAPEAVRAIFAQIGHVAAFVYEENGDWHFETGIEMDSSTDLEGAKRWADMRIKGGPVRLR